MSHAVRWSEAPPAAETFTDTAEAARLLELLVWCGAAAGVAGVVVVGTHLALALRRGQAVAQLGSLGWVLAACVVVATAAPLVNALL